MATVATLNVGASANDGTGDTWRDAFRKINQNSGVGTPMPGLGWINVRGFGAVADGVTDDNLAIRAAFTAATYGSVVYFPAGTYYTTTGFTLTAHKLMIVGDGAATIINCNFGGSSITDFVFWSNNFDDVTIRDLTINGTHAGGVSLFSGARCRLLRLNISGATLNNTSGFCAGIYAQDNDDLMIDNCSLSGNGKATGEGHGDIICNLGVYRLTNSRITNNRCSSTLVNYNIGVFDPRNVLIQGNECTGAVVSSVSNVRHGYGISVYHTGGVDPVMECRILGNSVHDVQGCAIYVANVPDTIVSNNFIRDCCTTQVQSSLPVAGIGLDAGSRYTCTGNRVHTSTVDGITLSSCTDVTITGNVLTTITNHGIAIRGVCSDCVITSNEIKGVGLSGVGVWSDTASVRIRVANNNIRTLTGAGTTTGILCHSTSSAWSIEGNDVSDIGSNTDFAIHGTNHSFKMNKTEGKYLLEEWGANVGDADVTLAYYSPQTVRYATALSANRTVTLPATDILRNHKFRIVRTGLGAFTLNVGGLKTIPSATAAFVDVEYSASGTQWLLSGYGVL